MRSFIIRVGALFCSFGPDRAEGRTFVDACSPAAGHPPEGMLITARYAEVERARVSTTIAAAMLLVLTTTLAHTATAAERPPIQLEFATRKVIVRGATPRGTVVLFSVHRQVFSPGYVHRTTWNFTADAGPDGVASVATPEDIDPERIWLAVDESSARNAIRRSSSAREIKRVPPGLLKHSDDGAEGVSIPLSMAHVLVVRANEGAWLGRVADGGSSDADHTPNGRIVISADALPDMRGRGRKQIKFRKNDLILAIDPVTLQVLEERLP